MLDGLITRGKLPPSLLFTGPPGSGKELTAMRLAARLNCEHATGGSGCPCASCARVSKIEHPDLHVVYPVPYGDWERSMTFVLESRREDFFNHGEFGNRARSIGINIVRWIIETVSKQPYEGRNTVVLLFEAHLMTAQAQNALLKVLEEPPSSTVLVMVTELPDKLLPTIVSRCQQVMFERLAAEAVASFLGDCRAVEAGEADRIGLIAQGDLKRAVRLLEERFLGIRKDAASMLKMVIDGNARGIIEESETAAGRYSREEVGELLEEIAALLSLVMSLGVTGGGAGELLLGVLGEKRLARAEERDIPGDLSRVLAARRSLGRNPDVELTLSQLLLDLAGKWY